MKPTEESHGPRVAIAEDDESTRTVLATIFRSAGYAVTEAQDGQELLDALEATPPGFFDVVITDQRMPRACGLDCLAQAGARAPFVIVSGETDATFCAAAARFGAAAVLRKPVDARELLELVRDLLAHDRLRAVRAITPAAWRPT